MLPPPDASDDDGTTSSDEDYDSFELLTPLDSVQFVRQSRRLLQSQAKVNGGEPRCDTFAEMINALDSNGDDFLHADITLRLLHRADDDEVLMSDTLNDVGEVCTFEPVEGALFALTASELIWRWRGATCETQAKPRAPVF